jgi:transposase
MLTRMTEEDWATVLEVFRACRSRRGAKGRNDRIFLEALHDFAVHNITWRALPEAFGNWNSVWKRFWRLSQAGVFEAFFDALAATSRTAHLVQMLDPTCSTPPSCGRMSRPQGPKGAGWSSAGPLPRRFLDQDPPQG